jgi:hypothetical protein
MSTGLSTSIKSTYIVFLTKMQKRQIPKMRFAFLISENTMFLKLIMLSFALIAYIQIMGNVQAHQRQGNAAELLTRAAPCSAQYITLFL